MLFLDLLAEHATIMNRHGLDSHEEKEFFERYKENKELVELCKTAHELKEAAITKSKK